MRPCILTLSVLLITVPINAGVNVPLTVQEAIYPGSVPGVTRTADPVTTGIPLPDDPTNGVTDVSQLAISGAPVGQFRVLGRWPSGRIKWVLVDTQASLNAGQANTSIALTDGGSGNFGGSNLATDNGATITVNTGAATFTIRKANFNGIDQAVVAGKTVVASGTSQGFVVTGPAPGQTTCPPCTTTYSSANDANSTAVIEENGPVRAVIKATGAHVDAAGDIYMRFTARMYFYKGKTFVKVTSILRNADYGTSNTFATAYKGHQGYELRITPNLSGALNYSFGNHTATPTTGTMSGADSVYLYQGESQSMKWQDWCGFGCVPYTKDAGYSIVKNGTALISGSDTQYPQGWADISDAQGAGVEIGVYQLAAYWPKSLEFNNGGSDVRIGIWARENSQPYYQVWPQWSIHDLYLNFHAGALTSPANEFLRFQQYLIGRASYAYYNRTGVFPYTLVDPTVEDNYYRKIQQSASPAISAASACCIQDFGVSDLVHWPLHIFRYYAWNAPGGANQTEFRWSYLLNFLTRGMTGRYLEAAHFYRFQAESAWPHSDEFRWMDHPGEVNGFGFPTAVYANSSLAFQNWRDQEHGHWYGMPDFYFMTGDETIHDALLDGAKEWFLNSNTYQAGAGGGLYNSRAIGVQLIGAARMAQFLQATGDPDAATVLAQGANTYAVQVKPDLCVSGYPAGCSIGGPIDGGPFTTQGVSRVRGAPWGAAGTSGSWCGVSHAYRVNSSFQPAILIQGILEYRNAQGPGWPEYWNSLDLAYGIARWNLSENYVDNGNGQWDVNGFRFGLALDRANSCTQPGESPEPDFQPVPTQTTSMTFLAKYVEDGDTSWAQKFNINLQKDMAALGMTTSDFGSYQPAQIISILSNPSQPVLTAVPITSFTANGGGSYTIGWTVPAGAQSYRVKWGAKQIVDWVGFDPANNVFTGDPVNTMPWFAANNISNIPVPAVPGTVQTLTISTGVTGLTSANFSVKAYVAAPSGPVSPAASLVLVSGNNQTGAAGQPLANAFTVKVLDSSGNPVSGVSVTFSVTAGGGTLSASSVLTDNQGLASTVLTLGSSAGTNTVVASSGTLAGSPITFTASASAASSQPANLVMVSGNGQTGAAGQQLPGALTVKVTDANGNPVSGVSVTFSVTAGGGTISAASATTDSQGLASTRLTLGASAGTNTVVASSGTLAGSPITFNETGAASGSSQTTVAWSLQAVSAGWPVWIGWTMPLFDPVSQQTAFYISPGAYRGIYSTHMLFYNSATNTFTDIGGTSSTGDACPADTASQPGDRHPVEQMAIDTKRNILWLYGGLNVNCTDNPRRDMYYLTLNPNPQNDVWHQVTPAHLPLANSSAAMVYDPDDDVLFAFGSDIGSQTHDNWVYCRTAENPTPGVLTAKQTAAGCAAPDDWSQVAVTGGVQPQGVSFPGIAYDTVTKKILLYGGMNGGLTTSYNETWAYDVPTRTWTQKALSTAPPPPYSGSNVAQPAMAYNPATHRILYHQTSNSGAPADWEYDPVADTWTKLASSGGGAASDAFMAYDAAHNVLVSWNQNTATGAGNIFLGSLSGVSNACDLNADGAVNVLDVQAAIRQALGQATCSTADLNGDHVCNTVDVQRIITASLGSACQVGQ